MHSLRVRFLGPRAGPRRTTSVVSRIIHPRWLVARMCCTSARAAASRVLPTMHSPHSRHSQVHVFVTAAPLLLPSGSPREALRPCARHHQTLARRRRARCLGTSAPRFSSAIPQCTNSRSAVRDASSRRPSPISPEERQQNRSCEALAAFTLQGRGDCHGGEGCSYEDDGKRGIACRKRLTQRLPQDSPDRSTYGGAVNHRCHRVVHPAPGSLFAAAVARTVSTFVSGSRQRRPLSTSHSCGGRAEVLASHATIAASVAASIGVSRHARAPRRSAPCSIHRVRRLLRSTTGSAGSASRSATRTLKPS